MRCFELSLKETLETGSVLTLRHLFEDRERGGNACLNKKSRIR